jgi:hypothetical protein
MPRFLVVVKQEYNDGTTMLADGDDDWRDREGEFILGVPEFPTWQEAIADVAKALKVNKSILGAYELAENESGYCFSLNDDGTDEYYAPLGDDDDQESTEE